MVDFTEGVFGECLAANDGLVENISEKGIYYIRLFNDTYKSAKKRIILINQTMMLLTSVIVYLHKGKNYSIIQ